MTSWGLAGLFAVAGLTPDERVVFTAIPADAAGLRPSAPLRVAAMNASATVRLGFDGVAVDAADVIVALPLDEWLAQDRITTAQPNPAAFGVAATCLHFLRDTDARAAAALDAEWQDCRNRSYGAAAGDDLDAQVALRAWSLELTLRCTYALIVATGGRAMGVSHPAQRLLREAAFYAIQAQTTEQREATLRRVAQKAGDAQ